MQRDYIDELCVVNVIVVDDDINGLYDVRCVLCADRVVVGYVTTIDIVITVPGHF